MICPHCEKSKEINCHCDKPRTLSSMEAPDDVKDLALDLSPWPISNERAWAIIDDHLGPLRSKIKLLRQTIKHQERIIEFYEKERNERIKAEESTRQEFPRVGTHTVGG